MDREGEYFADVDDDGTGGVFVDDDKEEDLPIHDFGSDTSSIVDELCFGEEQSENETRFCETHNEVLGGAEIPLSPVGVPEDSGSRRVSIVNGLEEELPVPIIMVVIYPV